MYPFRCMPILKKGIPVIHILGKFLAKIKPRLLAMSFWEHYHHTTASTSPRPKWNKIRYYISLEMAKARDYMSEFLWMWIVRNSVFCKSVNSFGMSEYSECLFGTFRIESKISWDSICHTKILLKPNYHNYLWIFLI